MDKLEKVISNLAILRTWCAVNPNYGIGLSVNDCQKVTAWLDDALELLKAQEPRVLAIKEAEKSHVCCIEDRDGDVEYPVCMIPGWGYMEVFEMANETPFHRNMSEYNKTWRCWDKEPTKEQMEALPWIKEH